MANATARKTSTTVKQTPSSNTKAKTAATQTIEQKLEATLESNDLAFHRGRTYASKAVVEAAARALNRKTDGAEIVAGDKADAVTVAVAIVRKNGTVYIQNLKKA